MAQNLNILNKTISSVTAILVTNTSSNTVKYIDTSDANALAGEILSNKTAYVDGSKITGTIAFKDATDLTTSAQTVTVPSGYYSSQVTKDIAGGEAFTPAVTITNNPTISIDANGLIIASYESSSSITPTISSGYISTGTAGVVSVTGSSTYQLPTLSATTITPSTTNQILSSGQYIGGAQTILGDTNLVASNIASGVSIFGVVGTLSGGGEGNNKDGEIVARTISEYSNNTVSQIGEYAFYNCSNLTTVSLSLVTSIGACAFWWCSALTTISLPLVTDIGSYAFTNCSALTTISLPLVTNIDQYVFSGCKTLTTISLPLVTNIGQYAFSGCRTLTTISLPLVTSISQRAFTNCSALTTISLPLVMNISSSAFLNCSHLLSVYFLNSSVLNSCPTNVFASTPISTYTTYTDGVRGTIYVRESLLSKWKTTLFDYSSIIVGLTDEQIAALE